MKLERIFVKNFLIIPSADISLAAGLTAVTGETGSGKSLFVSALKLLRGERASKKMIGVHGKTAEISAVLELDERIDKDVVSELKNSSILSDGEFRIVVRRVIGDKSLAFIQDIPIALSTLQRIFSS